MCSLASLDNGGCFENPGETKGVKVIEHSRINATPEAFSGGLLTDAVSYC